MSYISNKSGIFEVYIRPFPDMSKDKRQVSIDGGVSTLWSPDGLELFYRSGNAAISVSVDTEPSLKLGNPTVLFRVNCVSHFLYEAHPWDISPDGKRFLMMKRVGSTDYDSGDEAPRQINVVLNWFEELKELVPVQ